MKSTPENFDSTFNEVAVGMAKAGIDGVFLRVNKRFAEMLGYTCEEIEGKSFNSITYEPDHQKGLEAVRVMLSEEERAVSFEKRYLAKSGAIVWVRVTSTVVTNSAQEPQYFLTVFENITDQKAREKESSDQKLRMVAASKINGVGRMAAGMAHEINNPLTIVMGQASRLKKMAADGKLSQDAVFSMAEQIETMSLRIADIISGLRSFAREGSDEPIISTSLRQVLSDALKFSRSKILFSNINLIVDEGKTDINLQSRGVHLTQALLNLINNAKDAVEGKKNATIEVKITSGPKNAGFEVHDNGEGVSEDRLPFLFQPFFTTKAVGLGTGLGLSITKDLVEKYGGEISYLRSPLGGACFKIVFK